MLLARRRLWWLTPLAAIFVNCSEQAPPNTVVPTPTSVIIKPESFLGDVACGTEPGGLLVYQATLIDVTQGLEDAPRVSTSSVVDCTSTVVFAGTETEGGVRVGRRYGAVISAFDRNDLRPEDVGSEVVVGPDGEVVAPAWTTRCTGHDGEIDEALGGAGGQADGEGGWTGNTSLGVLAVEHAAVPIGGCAPLSGTFDPDLTGVRVEPSTFLGTLACGQEAGQVHEYSATIAGEIPAEGGAGGVGGEVGSGEAGSGAGGSAGEGERTSCDEATTLRGLAPGSWVTLEVLAYEEGAGSAAWSTTCSARTMHGALVLASCERLRSL